MTSCHIENASYNKVWKWLVIHNDYTALWQPKKYQEVNDRCLLLFGPDSPDGFGYGPERWDFGKMGWMFKTENDAKVCADMFNRLEFI
jgi:hypothetical protein